MSLEKADLDPDSQFMLVSIPRAAGKSLQQAAADGTTVSVWLPHYSTFDFNAVLLWAVAVVTFALAGICAANDCKAPAASSSLDDQVSRTHKSVQDLCALTIYVCGHWLLSSLPVTSQRLCCMRFAALRPWEHVIASVRLQGHSLLSGCIMMHPITQNVHAGSCKQRVACRYLTKTQAAAHMHACCMSACKAVNTAAWHAEHRWLPTGHTGDYTSRSYGICGSGLSIFAGPVFFPQQCFLLDTGELLVRACCACWYPA